MKSKISRMKRLTATMTFEEKHAWIARELGIAREIIAQKIPAKKPAKPPKKRTKWAMFKAKVYIMAFGEANTAALLLQSSTPRGQLQEVINEMVVGKRALKGLKVPYGGPAEEEEIDQQALDKLKNARKVQQEA